MAYYNRIAWEKSALADAIGWRFGKRADIPQPGIKLTVRFPRFLRRLVRNGNMIYSI